MEFPRIVFWEPLSPRLLVVLKIFEMMANKKEREQVSLLSLFYCSVLSLVFFSLAGLLSVFFSAFSVFSDLLSRFESPEEDL